MASRPKAVGAKKALAKTVEALVHWNKAHRNLQIPFLIDLRLYIRPSSKFEKIFFGCLRSAAKKQTLKKPLCLWIGLLYCSTKSLSFFLFQEGGSKS